MAMNGPMPHSSEPKSSHISTVVPFSWNVIPYREALFASRFPRL